MLIYVHSPQWPHVVHMHSSGQHVSHGIVSCADEGQTVEEQEIEQHIMLQMQFCYSCFIFIFILCVLYIILN